MELISKNNLRNMLFCLIALVTLNGCAANKITNIENYIGLYEIVDKECEVAQSDLKPCQYDLFFELLKGQFAGVEDSELAIVFWSGDPKIDSELQYTSHLIRNHKLQRISGNKFWLSNDDESQEYLIFSSGKLIEYHALYNSSDSAKRRTIHYKLKHVRRGNFPSVRLNYPGNK